MTEHPDDVEALVERLEFAANQDSHNGFTLKMEAAAALREMREIGEKDYAGMRDMQAKYIHADHARIKAEAERDDAVSILRAMTLLLALKESSRPMEPKQKDQP